MRWSSTGRGRRGGIGDGTSLVSEPALPPLRESFSGSTAQTESRSPRGALFPCCEQQHVSSRETHRCPARGLLLSEGGEKNQAKEPFLFLHHQLWPALSSLVCSTELAVKRGSSKQHLAKRAEEPEDEVKGVLAPQRSKPSAGQSQHCGAVEEPSAGTGFPSALMASLHVLLVCLQHLN